MSREIIMVMIVKRSSAAAIGLRLVWVAVLHTAALLQAAAGLLVPPAQQGRLLRHTVPGTEVLFRGVFQAMPAGEPDQLRVVAWRRGHAGTALGPGSQAQVVVGVTVSSAAPRRLY